jgi:prepilin signal peptidase PulO-like enzyme (type II secretory pathway)
LVPIFSWLVHQGRCRQCGAGVPDAYALIEFLLGSAFALSYLTLGATPVLPFFLTALIVLLFIVLYDLRHMIVPVGASSSLLAISTFVAILSAPTPHALGLTFIVAGVIALFFYLLHVCSRGRAMGLGDAPVALALSMLVGTQAFAGLLFSFWIGALYGVYVLSTRRGGPRMGIEVPFVPFLALGYLLAFFTAWNPFTLVLW